MRRDGHRQAKNQQNHQRMAAKNPIFLNNLTIIGVTRQAHNLKAAGSNPAPATNFKSTKPLGTSGVLPFQDPV